MSQLDERIEHLEKCVGELDATLGALIQAIPTLEGNQQEAKQRRSSIDKIDLKIIAL